MAEESSCTKQSLQPIVNDHKGLSVSTRLAPQLNLITASLLTKLLSACSTVARSFHARTVFDDVAIIVDLLESRFTRRRRVRQTRLRLVRPGKRERSHPEPQQDEHR
jgi:hypothetical protein